MLGLPIVDIRWSRGQTSISKIHNKERKQEKERERERQVARERERERDRERERERERERLNHTLTLQLPDFLLSSTAIWLVDTECPIPPPPDSDLWCPAAATDIAVVLREAVLAAWVLRHRDGDATDLAMPGLK